MFSSNKSQEWGFSVASCPFRPKNQFASLTPVVRFVGFTNGAEPAAETVPPLTAQTPKSASTSDKKCRRPHPAATKAHDITEDIRNVVAWWALHKREIAAPGRLSAAAVCSVSSQATCSRFPTKGRAPVRELRSQLSVPVLLLRCLHEAQARGALHVGPAVLRPGRTSRDAEPG